MEALQTLYLSFMQGSKGLRIILLYSQGIKGIERNRRENHWLPNYFIQSILCCRRQLKTGMTFTNNLLYFTKTQLSQYQLSIIVFVKQFNKHLGLNFYFLFHALIISLYNINFFQNTFNKFNLLVISFI